MKFRADCQTLNHKNCFTIENIGQNGSLGILA